jgi:hypothetical protein
MKPPTVLYISGSLGLGHVGRDLAIARQLRNRLPQIELSWLATRPATDFLQAAGERLLPEWSDLPCDTDAIEAAARGYGVDMVSFLFRAIRAWLPKAQRIARLVRKYDFDMVVGDEAYELLISLIFRRNFLARPFVMMYDFLGVDSRGPWRFLAYFWNLLWSLERRVYADPRNRAMFIGQPDDIPDRRFGLLLPNRRAHATRHYQFVGEVLRFDPTDYVGKQSAVRERLGIGPDAFVVCSIGGTSVGRELLHLCARAARHLEQRHPKLKMLLVAGPRLDPATLPTAPNVEVRGFVPNLHEYFAASDLAIVQGGGTTTLELTALRRPFLYFPLEGWSEQEDDVASRNQRNRAGEKLPLSRTTPESLAEKIAASLGQASDYAEIASDGARKAAEAIAKVIEERQAAPET